MVFGDDRLVGVVVKASTSRAEDSGFDFRLRRGDFSWSSHTSDLKLGTPVATLALLGQCWHWLARCQYTVTG